MIPDIRPEALEFLIESNRIEGIDIPSDLMLKHMQDLTLPVTSEIERHARNSARALAAAVAFSHEPTLTLQTLFTLHALQMEGLLEVTEIGQFRRVPVWVGGHDTPEPSKVAGLVSNWMRHYNDKKRSIPWLHFAFETIHPFVDGNGRTGRLLWAMDRLRRGNAIIPILDGFGSRGSDFYERRQQYYTAIQNHREKIPSITAA